MTTHSTAITDAMSSSRESYKNAINDDQVCGSNGINVTLNKEGTYNESNEATDNDGEMQLDARDHSLKVKNGCGDMNSPEFSNHADTLCISIQISDDSINKKLERKPLCLICGPPKGLLKTEYTKLSSYPDVEKEIRGLLKILSPPHESDACCGRCLGVMEDFLALKRKIIALHIDAQVDLPDNHGYGEWGEDHEMSDGENMSCNTNNQQQNSEVLIKHEIIDISFNEDNDHSKERESLKKHERNAKKTPLYLKPKVYHCSYCERTFNRANAHAMHEKSHTGKTNYKCEYCELSFTRTTDLKEHGRVHELKCSYCGKSCWGPTALNSHEKIHACKKMDNSAEVYKCSFCDKTFTYKSLLVLHESIHKCKHCEKSFKRKEDLREHDKTHELKCSYCGKSCMGTKALRKHERNHTVAQYRLEMEIYQCSQCNETFRRESEFFLHEISHSADNVKCKHCEDIFSKKSELLEHDKIHELKCSLCGKSCWGTQALDKHERIHIEDKPYTTAKKMKCSYCDETFTESELIFHEKSHTTEEFKCLQCEKIFSKKGDLVEHDKSHELKCCHCGKSCWGKKALDKHEKVHIVEKPYKCSTCDKAFLYKSYWQDHENTHTGERPYLCQYCTKSFAQSSTLKTHELTQHSGERPHKCQYCGQGFALKLACEEHERFHTGEKPFKCDHCNKRFVRKSNWRDHVKSHLGIKPQICSYCGKGFRDRRMLVIHEMIHTGERPFKCKYCDKAFNRKHHCSTHEKRHTGEKLVKQQTAENKVKSLAKIHKSQHSEDGFDSEKTDGLDMSQQLDSSFISQQFNSTYRPQHSESTFRPQHTDSTFRSQEMGTSFRGPHSSNVFPTPEAVYDGENVNPYGQNV